MIYKIELEKKVQRNLRKQDPVFLRELKRKHLNKIANDPRQAGKRLTGKLSGLWSYHFHFSGTQYRIIYKIFEEQVLIVVIDIGKRENIYQRVQRKI